MSRGREPQDFCELLNLSVFVRPAWAKQLGLAGVLEWHGGYHHAARARVAVLFAESLGGTESLVMYPLVQTHGSIPGPMLDKLGIDERLLRLSVGLENAEDLIADLEQAIG